MSAALAAIGFSVATTVRTEIGHVSSTADGTRARYLATGAVERAIQWMMWGPGRRLPDGSARYWDYGQPRAIMDFPSGSAVVEFLPESGKLNINLAPEEDLMRVVAAVSGDPARARDIAQAIVHWRRPGAPANPLDGYYLSLTPPGGPTFRPRHASFQEIEELLLVRGMTPELFYGNYTSDAAGRLQARGGLRDCLSVYGVVGSYDVNAASPALLEAIGVPPPAIDTIVRRRSAQPFRRIQDLTDAGIPTQRLRIGGTNLYTIRATARLRRPDGGPSDVVRTAAATVQYLVEPEYQAMPVHVLRFYEDGWSQFAVAPPGLLQQGSPLQ